MSSIPQTYTISDYLEWDRQEQLILEPKFQRGSVWTPQAKTFLIDTILRKLPIPSVYLRTKVDARSQKSIREVVDGQQRLRAIIAFAKNDMKLSSRVPNFGGMRYSDLNDEDKEAFLSYRLTTVQLLNSNDAEVLEVFARLNSYSVKVTPAELRHSRYDEPIKWAIWDTTRRWSELWDRYHVVTLRESVRMKNTTLIAELFMALLDGFVDGGENKVTRFYNAKKKLSETETDAVAAKINDLIRTTVESFGNILSDTTFFDSPNFLVLTCAIAFVSGELPLSKITENVVAYKNRGMVLEYAIEKLGLLGAAVDNEDLDGQFAQFVFATKSSTQTLNSRKMRFEYVVRALTP
jgi:Protein of unknown function DUF262